jgi:hypothetical protein
MQHSLHKTGETVCCTLIRTLLYCKSPFVCSDFEKACALAALALCLLGHCNTVCAIHTESLGVKLASLGVLAGFGSVLWSGIIVSCNTKSLQSCTSTQIARMKGQHIPNQDSAHRPKCNVLRRRGVATACVRCMELQPPAKITSAKNRTECKQTLRASEHIHPNKANIFSPTNRQQAPQKDRASTCTIESLTSETFRWQLEGSLKQKMNNLK